MLANLKLELSVIWRETAYWVERQTGSSLQGEERNFCLSLTHKKMPPLHHFCWSHKTILMQFTIEMVFFSVQSSESGEGQSPIWQKKMHLMDKFFVGDGASFLTGTLDLDS
jgi:hypothetical protein